MDVHGDEISPIIHLHLQNTYDLTREQIESKLDGFVDKVILIIAVIVWVYSLMVLNVVCEFRDPRFRGVQFPESAKDHVMLTLGKLTLP